MGVVTFTEDIASPVPAPRLFKALILDADNLIPKIVPQAIRSIETIQGDGGPGSIKQMNFAEGSPFKCLKHRIDALMDKLEFISYEMKLESDANGGCVGKNISKYHAKPGVEIKEEEIKAGKEKASAVFKAVEAYLLANPNAYA
ncbi:major allergen Pru av 1-like [Camellia sinensis]|uniref:major allergen Pru av 1-like n=1 Tax=Camellia sinensis TaxID=4442 RepID=UPI001035A695|nr:major allergen Pru av 1-like [Camellia sinensis]XP_028100646.1 major allergen Pru av 1-like [Camellia sinensis]